MSNKNMHAAKRAKNDEFYTQMPDIERELIHYREHFKDKVVYCNCNDSNSSNFFKFFGMNFNSLGLRKLITTGYTLGGQAVKIEITEVKDFTGDGRIGLEDVEYFLEHDEDALVLLEGDGDFRSEECIALLEEADITVTNPPFSLFREYVTQLIEYDKRFLIIGSLNAITYKEIFPLLKEDKMWLGYTNPKSFLQPDGSIKKFGNILWYTNLEHDKRNEELILYKKYTPEEYPQYDNYEAIEVSRTANIPLNYAGVMGVPITFLTKHNPEQFEIIGCSYSYGEPKGYHFDEKGFNVSVDGKEVYKRLFIQRN